MKLLRYEYEGKSYTGFLSDDTQVIIPISRESMLSIIENYSQHELLMMKAELEEDNRVIRIPLSETTLLPPIERPAHDILCVGKNYKDHELEVDRFFGEKQKKRDETVYFTKRAVRTIGHNEDVVSIPLIDQKLDYEVELAVIIGREGKNISKEDVRDYIFGYTVFNDYSARELQHKHLQWFKGKSVDTYSAIGPWLVTFDEIAWPVELNISCKVNGKVRQQSNTKLMMSDIPTIIHELSQGMTLVPGDIIATGTPAGVAMGMEIPKFLQKGDIVECEIEKVGILRNQVK